MVSFPSARKESEVAQSCPTRCDSMDCSLSGSSIHGIFQATVLEWVDISFSRGSSRPRNQTRVSHIAGRCFTHLSHHRFKVSILLSNFWNCKVLDIILETTREESICSSRAFDFFGLFQTAHPLSR